MGSNGADNAHNNAFGGGKNPGIGGGSNSSGSHSSGNGGGNANSGSGWSNVNTPQGTLHAYTGGETSGYVGSKGNGGQQVVGWGWKMDDRPETAKDYVDANGQVRITITKGLVKAPVYGPVSGANQGNGGHSGSAPGTSTSHNWNTLPTEFDTTVDGFKYHVTLNDKGQAIGIKRTATRGMTKAEKLQDAGAKFNPGNPKFPPVDLEKNEPSRQATAKKQAEAAWKNLPPNVRSFNVNVDGFQYGVTLDDYGSITSFKKIADRPLTKIEAAQKHLAEYSHRDPAQMYPGLDFSKGEPERQAQAKRGAQDIFNSFPTNQARVQADVLNKTADIVTDMGEKLSHFLGEKYKSVANELAKDIKNFQGKTIRSFDDAMKSLNKITSSPGMKINKGNKDALINAWKQMDAQKMADNLGHLSKAFNVADKVLKAEKIREKSIEGYDTGNWGPLMLEVESWVLSGVAASVAIGIFAAVLSALPITGLALITITIAGIITISYLAAKIDDKVAEMINKELIKPAN
ncbi:hypothetical protein DX293_22995 [Salmonella enterica]|nr:hypothetical protein [Salmonella enterica]